MQKYRSTKIVKNRLALLGLLDFIEGRAAEADYDVYDEPRSNY